MKKTCGNCWNGGRGKENGPAMVNCRKIGQNVHRNKQRPSCKHWCDGPREPRPDPGYIFNLFRRW